jgi:hypothetical protein
MKAVSFNKNPSFTIFAAISIAQQILMQIKAINWNFETFSDQFGVLLGLMTP